MWVNDPKSDQMNQQRVGTVVHFSPERSFGFISSRIEGTAMLEKFFFHVSRIVFSEIEISKIPIGAFARFYPSTQAPKRPNDAKYAMDVQIFKSEASAAAAELAASTSATEVQ